MAVRPLSPELRQRLAPLGLAVERRIPLPEALSGLVPMGGIQRGWQVGVDGPGGWSVALALWAAALGSEALGDGSWLAVVGGEDLGLAAAHGFGLPLDRVVLIETPPRNQWADVVAALLDAFEIVAVAPDGPVGRRDARRLAVRAREQGTVLFHLDGGRAWPEPLDVLLRVHAGPWEGIGRGHGHLRRRSLPVRSEGRRVPGPERSATITLPGPGPLTPPLPEPGTPVGVGS